MDAVISYFTSTAIEVWLAVIADRLLGDPRRFHPLAGFGALASAMEERMRAALESAPATQPKPANPADERFAGIFSVAMLVLAAGMIAGSLADSFPALPVPVPFLRSLEMHVNMLEVIILYFCIASKSLEEHAEAVAQPLRSGDLTSARAAIGRIVSRDTADLNRGDLSRACVESVLENGNDAVFGALFWFVLLGAPGAAMFRLANTLDAMWGYRNERYRYFGWAAARLDDALNFIPARLTAASYCLAGDFANGWQCWREQARTWYSPNAGPVMAAGAGALGVMLGGRAQYGGQFKERPVLGCGHAATAEDIAAAIALLRRSLAIWLAAITLLPLAIWFLPPMIATAWRTWTHA